MSLFVTKVTVSDAKPEQNFWENAGRTLGGPVAVNALKQLGGVVDVVVNRAQPVGTFVVVFTTAEVAEAVNESTVEVTFGKTITDYDEADSNYVITTASLRLVIV